MSQREINQWRTVGLVAGACLLLATVFLVVILRAGAPLPLGDVDRLWTALTDAVVWLVAVVALKASVQHLAGGGGARGAWKALTTSAKPGDPEPPQQPPGAQP